MTLLWTELCFQDKSYGCSAGTETSFKLHALGFFFSKKTYHCFWYALHKLTHVMYINTKKEEKKETWEQKWQLTINTHFSTCQSSLWLSPCVGESFITANMRIVRLRAKKHTQKTNPWLKIMSVERILEHLLFLIFLLNVPIRDNSRAICLLVMLQFFCVVKKYI